MKKIETVILKVFEGAASVTRKEKEERGAVVKIREWKLCVGNFRVYCLIKGWNLRKLASP